MNREDELVSHLMSTPIVALNPRVEVGELLRLSQSLNIHHFPLVNDDGLFGVVCTCDVAGARPEQAVSQFARRAPVTVRPEATAREAAAQMAHMGVGSVLIADDEGVWGILTRDDLAEAVPGADEERSLPSLLEPATSARRPRSYVDLPELRPETS